MAINLLDLNRSFQGQPFANVSSKGSTLLNLDKSFQGQPFVSNHNPTNPTNIKTFFDLAYASTKTAFGLALSSMKTWGGLE